MGLDLDRDVTRIIVTHLHPDHIGLARWLEERSGAPVLMLDDEISNARHVWDPARGSEDFVRYMMRHGMDPETAGATAGTTRLGIRLRSVWSPCNPKSGSNWEGARRGLFTRPVIRTFTSLCTTSRGGYSLSGIVCC
jgi:hypothetical protein